MKYIKLYEIYKRVNFEINDIVICIDTNGAKELTMNNAYKIKDINLNNEGQVLLFEKFPEKASTYWFSSRFRLATEEEIEDYMMKNTAKKYNL